MDKKWYEYNLKDRYEQIYKSFSLEDFWNWWSDGEDVYMEVRIMDYKPMVAYAKQYHVPYSHSGLYVNKAWQLQKIVEHFGSTTTMWFGVNPKRALKNKHGFMGFSGKDIHIAQSKFLFIDVDRVVKEGVATQEDLMNADFLIMSILKELGEAGFNKNHCKICSGNGAQLIIKLDVPIELPMPKFNSEIGEYVEDTLFEQAKSVIKEGIGKILPTFSKQFREKYNVEIDSTGFNVGRVAALHMSFNFKYDTKIPRGIVEIVNKGKNEGLSDYLRDIYLTREIKESVKHKYKKITPIILSEEYKMIKNELQHNAIIDLMMNYSFPDGGINNTLWYGVKLLLHNSGIDSSDAGYRKTHQMLKTIHKRSFSQNGLEKKYNGNYDGAFKKGDIDIIPTMINKYLRNHKIVKRSNGMIGFHKPIFSVSPRGKHRQKHFVNITPKLFNHKAKNEYTISSIMEDPLKDLQIIAQECHAIRIGEFLDETYKIGKNKFTDIGNIMLLNQLNNKFIGFMHAFRDKWKDEITIYMMKYYMEDYLNYSRW